MAEKKIMSVGLVCVDIIQLCKEYPKEDSDQRSIHHRWQRGGNASNNCTVLANCGQACEFFGSMSDDIMATYAKQDFEKHRICTENVVIHHNGVCPFSSVLINKNNGTRTIIHSNKNMAEVKLTDLKKLDLRKYCWIHFEGRNVKEVCLMLEYIRDWNTKHAPVQTSVELEKPRAELLPLLPLADFVFLGKDFALMQGCRNKCEAMNKNIGSLKPGATIIVAWGETGAVACRTDETPVESPAFPPSRVVDTLGAGDTFVAISIFCLSRGLGLGDSITAACKVAGVKVSTDGFSAVSSELLKELEIHI